MLKKIFISAGIIVFLFTFFSHKSKAVTLQELEEYTSTIYPQVRGVSVVTVPVIDNVTTKVTVQPFKFNSVTNKWQYAVDFRRLDSLSVLVYVNGSLIKDSNQSVLKPAVSGSGYSEENIAPSQSINVTVVSRIGILNITRATGKFTSESAPTSPITQVGPLRVDFIKTYQSGAGVDAGLYKGPLQVVAKITNTSASAITYPVNSIELSYAFPGQSAVKVGASFASTTHTIIDNELFADGESNLQNLCIYKDRINQNQSCFIVWTDVNPNYSVPNAVSSVKFSVTPIYGTSANALSKGLSVDRAVGVDLQQPLLSNVNINYDNSLKQLSVSYFSLKNTIEICRRLEFEKRGAITLYGQVKCVEIPNDSRVNPDRSSKAGVFFDGNLEFDLKVVENLKKLTDSRSIYFGTRMSILVSVTEKNASLIPSKRLVFKSGEVLSSTSGGTGGGSQIDITKPTLSFVIERDPFSTTNSGYKLKGTVNDNLSISSVVYKVNNGVEQQVQSLAGIGTTNGSFNQSFNFPVCTQSTCVNTVNAYATDRAGNRSDVVTQTVTVTGIVLRTDSVKPTLNASLEKDTLNSPGVNYDTNNGYKLKGTVNDNLSIDQVVYAVNNGAELQVQNLTGVGTVSGSFEQSVVFPVCTQGTCVQTVKVYATDKAGNRSDTLTLSVTVSGSVVRTQRYDLGFTKSAIHPKGSTAWVNAPITEGQEAVFETEVQNFGNTVAKVGGNSVLFDNSGQYRFGFDSVNGGCSVNAGLYALISPGEKCTLTYTFVKQPGLPAGSSVQVVASRSLNDMVVNSADQSVADINFSNNKIDQTYTIKGAVNAGIPAPVSGKLTWFNQYKLMKIEYVKTAQNDNDIAYICRSTLKGSYEAKNCTTVLAPKNAGKGYWDDFNMYKDLGLDRSTFDPKNVSYFLAFKNSKGEYSNPIEVSLEFNTLR